MDSTSASAYSNLTNQLESYGNIIPKDLITSFRLYTQIIYKSSLQDKYSQPVPWIGMYIALGSLVCILAMMADLLHGFRNRIRWFPCKYFTLNSASLSMMAVAIKIPMDLSNGMPTKADQVTKIGSLAFMCTMMVNSLPSLATMNDQQLVANVIALGVLVITLVVNVCIQIYTGVITHPKSHDFVSFDKSSVPIFADQNKVIASIYVAMLLFLLIIYISSALAISVSKRMLESSHQINHERALKELGPGRVDVEMSRSYVTKCWVMAETVTPEFMKKCSPTSSASGVICVLSMILFTRITVHLDIDNHDSDYKWSIPVILVTQFIGVILGTIAPVSRCLAPFFLRRMSITFLWEDFYVFAVDDYWIRTLLFREQRPLLVRLRSRLFVIEILRFLAFRVCIWLQKTVVMACKMVALIPNLLVLVFKAFKGVCRQLSCFNSLEESRMYKPDELQVYLLQHDILGGLPQILKSVDHVIKKAEEQQPKYLMKLLEKSTSFEGIQNFYKHHLPPSTSREYLECWSLSLVTMTTIATSLPYIQKDQVVSLLRSMREGLSYVILVEERLDATYERASIQKAAQELWGEVKFHHKLLGNNVVKDLVAPPVKKTTRQILEWFKNTSVNILNEGNMFKYINIHDEDIKWDTFFRCYCANSMYQTIEAILLSYQDKIDELSPETLFDRLSSLISETLAACLISLPRVIALRCSTNMTEERKASIHAAARLLGKTMQIINALQDREIPLLNSNELPFMHEWVAYFKHHSSPP